MKGKGLTLMELLVVIGIILIFFTIGYYAFSAIREAGRITVCRSNLKQIGMALLSYEEDWESLPHDPWMLIEQVEARGGAGIFTCPSYKSNPPWRLIRSRPFLLATYSFPNAVYFNGKIYPPFHGHFYSNPAPITPTPGTVFWYHSCFQGPENIKKPEEILVACFHHWRKLSVCGEYKMIEPHPLPGSREIAPDRALVFRRDGSISWAYPKDVEGEFGKLRPKLPNP